MTGEPQGSDRTGLGRSVLTGILAWSAGLVVFSGVEDAVNVARGLYVPTATLGAIAVIYAAFGAAIGVLAGLGAFVLARLRPRTGGATALVLASVAPVLVLAFVGLKVNDRYLPDMLTAKSFAVNTVLVTIALVWFFALARHLARRRQPAAFLCVVLATALLVSVAMQLDTFVTPRLSMTATVLSYAGLAAACALLYAVLARLLGAWHALPPSRRGAVAGAGAAAALVAVALSALPGARAMDGAAHAKAGGPPNVVWLVLDTLRADHLSTYGYRLPTTPNLDRIGAEGAVFESAIAGASWTIPSHYQMVTGHYDAGRPRLLEEQFATAAELLRDRGYRTAAVLANPSLGRGSGFEQGFETFVDAPPLFLYLDLLGKVSFAEALANRRILSARTVQRLLYRKTFLQSARAEGDFINAHALRWLDGGGAPEPFFLFINYLDPHEPYDPQEPFRQQFAQGVGSEIGFIRYDRQLGRFISTEEMTRDVVPRTSPEHWRQMIQLYDAEIAFLDHQVGALVEELRRRGVYDNTVVVITSDHGELFGEHGLATHFKALTEEELRVPLIMRFPKGIPAGARVKEPVELVDILPTVLDLVGGEAPEMDGHTLRPLLGGNGGSDGETYSFLLRKPRKGFPHTSAGDLAAIRSPRSKYVWSSTGQNAFFDLEADVHERQNLYGDGRPPADVRTRLETWRLATGLDRAEGKLDRLTEDRLKSLGYID